jgi:hypothetical protein
MTSVFLEFTVLPHEVFISDGEISSGRCQGHKKQKCLDLNENVW